MGPGAGRRLRLRLSDVDRSATPLAPRMPLPAFAAASALAAAPLGWWLTRLGLPTRTAALACGWVVVVGSCAQEPVQRAIGGGRLDNRLLPRLVLAFGLFWAFTVTMRLGFLFPVSSLLIAAVHVHWSGSRTCRPAAWIAGTGTVLAELLVHLGLLRSWLPDPVSHTAAGFALWFSLLGLGNLGRSVERRERAAVLLAGTEQRFRTMLQHSSDLVLVVDRAGAIGYTTSAAESVVQHRRDQLVGRPVADLVHPDDREALLAQLAQALADPRPVRRELRAAGRDQWLELSARSLLEDPVVAGILVNVRDVTERRAFQDRLAHAAAHDDLTGLLSRAELVRRLGELAATAGPGAGVALLYVDLDGFKQVNDRLGHAAGDAVLVAVAERLTALLRPEDVVVRMGGDEFVAVLPRVPDVRAAEATVERVRELLVQPVPLPAGGRAQVGASIGLVYLDRPETDAEHLITGADAAMYHEKRDRRAARTNSP